MRNIILLTDPEQKHHVYGSIKAMLTDSKCPIKITERGFSKIQSKGWPVVYADCIVERLPVITTSDVDTDDNKPQSDKSAFSPVRCHLELYASIEGTAEDFLVLREQAKPVFQQFGLTYDLNVVFYNKLSGEYLDDDEINWHDSTIRTYRYQAVYDGREMYENQAKRILKSAEELRKYHKFHWHEQWVKPLL